MQIRNRKVVFPLVGVVLLIGLTAQVSFASAGSYESFSVGSNQYGVSFTGMNDSGKDISGFTIEIDKCGRTTIKGVLVESDQSGGCGDWDIDDDEDGNAQEEMEHDNWDSTPKSGKTMWTWYTRVDCKGKDGMDGVPIRKGEQYTIKIWFTEKTKNRAHIYIYTSDEENFQIAGTDIIGQEKNEPEKAAKILSDKISIPETSEVFFFGPLGPGTAVRENRPPDDQEPVKLEVPDESGTYYVFYIDDMPGFKFAHDVRYAWVNVETEKYSVVNAQWEPLILEPGVPPAPFGLIWTYEVKGVKYKYGEGWGKGYINNIDEKADARPVKKRDDDQLKPPFPSVHMPYNCIALVIDGGDVDPEPGKHWKEEKCDRVADQISKDADSIEHYLRKKGFYVQRISQYWDNTRPTIRYDPRRDAMDQKIKEVIWGLAEIPTSEFFLYIKAHGNKNGFVLFDPTGSGRKEFIRYSDLYGWLSKFSEGVNIVILIDSCKSGGAIEKLKELKDGRVGLTIMTAADDNTCAPSGEKAPSGKEDMDSATENFLEGRSKDLDNDGEKGLLGDCWKSMKNQGSYTKPQLYHVGSDSILGPVPHTEYKKVFVNVA